MHNVRLPLRCNYTIAMDKKEQIIEAAIDLFAQKGFEGTSIRDLASKADVNVAMVNYYFGSKDKLFEALVEVKAGSARGILEELLKDKTLTSIEKMNKDLPEQKKWNARHDHDK